MTLVRGIRSFSIAAITINGAALGFLVILIILDPGGAPGRGMDLFIFFLVVAGLLVGAIYPAQLLRVRKNYLDHRLITSSAKVLLHITRVMQLLFTSFVVIIMSYGIFYLFTSMRRYDIASPYAIQRMIIPFLVMAYVLTGVVVNAIVFFKGWRLLRRVQKSNYIDDVMASFDVGADA